METYSLIVMQQFASYVLDTILLGSEVMCCDYWGKL